MASDVTLERLFGQLEAMQACLGRDDADTTAQLLLLHDQELRQFLGDPGSDTGGAEMLGRLLAAQRAVVELMVAARDDAREQIQRSRLNDRASRAYLANFEP